jgi:hypothetical protein
MGSAKALVVVLSLLKVALAGAALGGIAILVAAIYKFHPASQKMQAELDQLKKTADSLAGVDASRFTRQLKEIGEMPVEKQREELEVMKRNLEGNLEASKLEIEKHRDEIAGMSSVLDSQGIALGEAHMEDARKRAELYTSQLQTLDAELKNVQATAASTGDDIMGTIRPAAIEEFTASLEKQLRNLEIERTGVNAGMTSGDIQRSQEMAALMQGLTTEGASLNEEERKRLATLNAQVASVEKQVEATKKRKKEEEEAKKKAEEAMKVMAGKAEEVIKASMTPVQELKSQIMEIDALAKAGALTGSESKTAKDKLVAEFAEANKVDKASAGTAVEFGSAESEANRIQQSNKSTEKGVWAMVDQAKINNRKQDDILAEMKKRGAPVAVGIPG